jgi:cyclic pyranopterin phosphate synthase
MGHTFDMQDAFDRGIDYLRVSVTDRCNLRCIYCMPTEGVAWAPHSEVLSFEETLRICSAAAGVGVRKIKITGGEPLVRRGIIPFVARLKKINGIEQVSMTSNGLVLEQYFDALIDAGLDAINISLDTLDEDRFAKITRNGNLKTILSAIERARKSPVALKINCVPMRGINEDDIIPIAALAKNENMIVRFIELMPLGYAASLPGIGQNCIAQKLEKQFGTLEPLNAKLGNGPASYVCINGFKSAIGFISAMSHIFCAACNRMRLTSTGLLKPCLSSDIAIDLKAIARSDSVGAGQKMFDTDAALAQAILAAAAQKPARHTFEAAKQSTNMFKIGG